MHYIIIRESRPEDKSKIAEVVRKAYNTNVNKAWCSALFNEITFQAIILLAAFMFILIGVPLTWCILSVPFVLVMMYILIYGAILMKATEIMSKRTLNCWVAEVYEPYFFMDNPQNCNYCILDEGEKDPELDIQLEKCHRKIIGTCAVMRHNISNEWAWLFRLAVDEKYRKKGVGLKLTQAVQNWCRNNRFNCVELVITECQDEARQLFANAGFHVRQLYHKKLFTSVVAIQMFQLRSDVRPTFL